MKIRNPKSYRIAAGCSLGAYHAINIALRKPGTFNKVVAMSGRYDLTVKKGHYDDLLDGYWDENIYFNMPLQYVANLPNDMRYGDLNCLEVVLAVGREDILLDSNLSLNELLSEKGIHSTLHIWDHAAHQAKAWRKMVAQYL